MAKYSVSSFPHEYLELLKHASGKLISFQLPHSDCVKYRASLYSLRAALRREHHPAAEAVNVVQITIKKTGPQLSTINIGPRDVEFADLISQQLKLHKPASSTKPEQPVDIPVEMESTEFDYLAKILMDDEPDFDDEPDTT